MRGQAFSTVVPLFKRAAAITGSAAFFDPCILTSPSKGICPVILIPFKLYTPLKFHSGKTVSGNYFMQFFFFGDLSFALPAHRQGNAHLSKEEQY